MLPLSRVSKNGKCYYFYLPTYITRSQPFHFPTNAFCFYLRFAFTNQRRRHESNRRCYFLQRHQVASELSSLQNVSSETQDTASDTANVELVGSTGEVCGSWLDGRTSAGSSARWWVRSQSSSDLAWCGGSEHRGCWHGSACSEGAVGDCDGLLGGSSIGGSLCWAWHDESSAGWADSGVARDGGCAVDDTSRGDGDTGSEGCGLGECARAL